MNSPGQARALPDRREALRQVLLDHQVADSRERASLRRTLALLDWLADPFDQDADPIHVTGSAIVLDHEDRVLLHRHKRLGRWLQPGGHVDAGEQVHETASRETSEETGLTGRHPPRGPALIHVDVHEGPRGHVHLDLRYLLLADGAATLVPAAGESRDVAWFSPAQACVDGDESLRAAVRAALRARPGS